MSGIRPKEGPPGLGVPEIHAQKARIRKNPVLARALGLVAPLEKHEQRMLFSWADVHRDPRVRLLYAIPNAGGYTGGFKKNAARVISGAREGSRKGFPDIGLPVAARKCHGLFIELKRLDAKPSDTSKDQLAWHEALTEQGFQTEICRGWEEAAGTIEAYLGIRR